MEDLLKALKLIKQTCARQECCKNCPLRGDRYFECMVNELPYEWNRINSLSIAGVHEVINARAKRSEDNAIIPLAARSIGTSIEVNPSANFGISKLILEYTK